ncbi:protein POLR1D [Pelobates fuscus]|uniref:protein POLR1D n=1 Tax=Pelobates fuscus TaxID=191477 RepID=UPI002FE4B7A4
MAGMSAASSGFTDEPSGTMKEDDLEREAVDELLKEAKRGKIRSETMGAMGWMKCPLASTNKRFLINTIKNALPPSKDEDQRSKRDQDETEDDRKEKRHSRTHKTHPYERSGQSQRDKSHSSSEHRKRNEHKDHSDPNSR